MSPWLKGTQVCSNKGPGPFPKGDKSVNTLTVKKKSSPEPIDQFQPNLSQSILG